MTSQDGLALLKQMHQRGEITDEQYDTLRRHVLWGTPLPQFGGDVPAPRSGAGGYVPGAATVGPDRFPEPPGRHPAEPAGYPVDPTRPPPGPAPRRYASRRERREAEEAAAFPPPANLPAADRRRAEDARARTAYLPPAASTGPLPPVTEAPPRRRHRRDDVDVPPPDDPAPTRRQRPVPPEHVPPEHVPPEHVPPEHVPPQHVPPQHVPPQHVSPEHVLPEHVLPEHVPPGDPVPTRRHRQAPPEEVTPRRSRPPAEPEPERRGRHGAAAPGKQKRRPRRRSVVAVLTSVVLALALAAGGVYWFELRRLGLPPPAYARQACGAVRDWQQAVDSSNARLIDQISRQQNKTTIRTDVTAYYTTVAGRTDQLRVAVLDLGPADLTGGREYADSLAAAIGDQAGGLRRLAGQAGRLDPAAATFQTDLQGILTGADAAVGAVTAALARPAAGITTELGTTLSNEPACAPYVG
jgi:hypothetical protein